MPSLVLLCDTATLALKFVEEGKTWARVPGMPLSEKVDALAAIAKMIFID